MYGEGLEMSVLSPLLHPGKQTDGKLPSSFAWQPCSIERKQGGSFSKDIHRQVAGEPKHVSWAAFAGLSNGSKLDL